MRKCVLLTIGLTMIFAGIAQADILTNLKAVYHLEADASDALGNYDASVASGAPAFALGKLGNATDLEASNTDYFRIDSPTIIAGDWGVSAWIKRESASTQYGASGLIGVPFGDATGTNGTTIRLEQYQAGNDLGFTDFSDTAGGITNNGDWSPYEFTDGVWAHLVMTRDSTVGITAYIDGASLGLMANGPLDGGKASPLGMDTIGTAAGYSVCEFDGMIDELCVWDRALGQADVTELYNNGDGVSIPEPMTMSLLGLGGLALLRRRR